MLLLGRAARFSTRSSRRQVLLLSWLAGSPRRGVGVRPPSLSSPLRLFGGRKGRLMYVVGQGWGLVWAPFTTSPGGLNRDSRGKSAAAWLCGSASRTEGLAQVWSGGELWRITWLFRPRRPFVRGPWPQCLS